MLSQASEMPLCQATVNIGNELGGRGVDLVAQVAHTQRIDAVLQLVPEGEVRQLKLVLRLLLISAVHDGAMKRSIEHARP
jgi:hypothetical protein